MNKNMPEIIKTPQDLKSYVDQVSVLLDISIDPDHLPGVLENLYRTQAIARLFLEFPLPETVEIAPVFQP